MADGGTATAYPRRVAAKKRAKRAGATKPEVAAHSAGPSNIRNWLRAALDRGDYETYARIPHGSPLSRAQFVQIHGILHAFETMLMGGAPLRVWQADALARVTAVLRMVDGHDEQLADLLFLCESFLRHCKLGKRLTVATDCVYIPGILGAVRSELGSLSPAQVAECMAAEQRKRIPGPASLAAALWNAAGLRGRGGRRLDNKAVSAAKKRAGARRARMNDDAK